MTQSNEHVFFSEAGIYISQYRFITAEGTTYPTTTLQQVYYSRRRPPWGCFSLLTGFITFFAFLGALASALLLAVAIEHDEEKIGISSAMLLLCIAFTVIGSLILILAAVRRRRRHIANFVFAGGGLIYNPELVQPGVNRSPDYMVWGRDEQWIRTLIAAASEAMVASQQT